MGFLDVLFSPFSQAGSQVTANITSPPQGAPYVSTYQSQTAAAQAPQMAVQQQDQSLQQSIGAALSNFSSAVDMGSRMVSSGIEGLQKAVAPIQQSPALLAIPAIASPLAAPIAIGAAGAAAISPFFAQPKSNAAPITTAMAGAPVSVSAKSPETLTVYMPYGNYAQTEVKNAKIGISEPGELAVYQPLRPGSPFYQLVGGGGRAALQSGTFSVEKPLTPAVYTQESGGTKFAKSADVGAAMDVLASPGSYSRLGAEVYGGYVQPLSGKTVQGTGAQLSTYSSPYNLANLVSPQAANAGKAELPGANIPWEIPASSPAISMMGAGGIGKAIDLPGVTSPSGGRLVGSGKVGGVAETVVTGDVGLPTPFISKAASEPTLPERILEGFSKAAATTPGGLPYAIAATPFTSKEAFSRAASDVMSIFNPPESEKKIVTPEKYNASLESYNKDKAAYESELASYNADLAVGKATQSQFSSLQAKGQALGTIYEQLKSTQAQVREAPTALDKVGSAWENLNRAIAPVTTDVFGIGSALEKTGPIVKEPKSTMAMVPDIVRGGAAYLYTHPLDIAATYGAGEAVGFVEGAVRSAGAAAVRSETPGIYTIGKAMSTPSAVDVANIGKAVMGGLYVTTVASDIVYAKTPYEKGQVIGREGGAGVVFGAGYGGYLGRYVEPQNPLALTTFFGGERKLPLTERAMLYASDVLTTRGLEPGQREVFAGVRSQYETSAFYKPAKVTEEPVLSNLTKVSTPKIEQAISKAIEEVPASVMYGSGATEAQLSNLPTGLKARQDILPSSDFDVRSIKSDFEEKVKKYGGDIALKATDIHDFPAGYLDVGQPRNIPASSGVGSYLFGSTLRINPLEGEITVPGKTAGYAGKIKFEQLNVQARILSQAVRDDVATPLDKGYRLPKDVARWEALQRDLIAVEEARGGKKASTAQIERVMKQKVTYKDETGVTRTETLREAADRYIAQKKGGSWEVQTPSPSIGAVPSISGAGSAISLASIVRSSAKSSASRSESPSARSPLSASSLISEMSGSPSSRSPSAASASKPSPSSGRSPSPLSPYGYPSRYPSEPSRPSKPSPSPSPSPTATRAPSASPRSSLYPPSPSSPPSPTKSPQSSISPKPPAYIPPPLIPFAPAYGGGVSGGMKSAPKKFVEVLGFEYSKRGIAPKSRSARRGVL